MKDNSKDNKSLLRDLIKMQGNQNVDFKEPDDYSIENPKVMIDGCQYKLFDGGSLSYATPKLLSETIRSLKVRAAA